MERCIYCKKSQDETTFSSGRGDEVVPQFLGKFALFFGDSVVCWPCNNALSKVETIFKEGSLAGIHSAVFGVDNKTSSIRVRKEKVNWKIVSEGGEIGVFSDTFPFVNPNRSSINPKPIVILDHKDSKLKYILFVEKYANFIEKESSQYKKRKESIKMFQDKFGKADLTLFGNEEWPIDKIVDILKCYGLSYNKKSEEKFEDKHRGEKWIVEYEENGDGTTLRTPLKMAFNYFAFCAKKSGMEDILFYPNFDPIREFIRLGKIPPVKYKPYFKANPEKNEKRDLHIIAFQEEEGLITCNISLFQSFHYRCVLGEYPFKINQNSFGCATAFSPFSGEVNTNFYASPTVIVGKPKYGLFCR